MVDWSGEARRRGGRSDTIWIAHGRRTADTPLTNSPRSRTEAIELIEPVLERAIRSKQRVLLCFDFAYGYPVDFAPALQAATGKSDSELPWIAVWQYLSKHLKDDEATTPGAKPSNRSNRFEVADRMNALLSPDTQKTGPFWCASEGAACQHIPQKRPPEPFQTAQGYAVKGLRLTDKRARSGSPFRLFGTASVGSQSLTGIARLHRLRNDPKLAGVSAVCPFETGWAAPPKSLMLLAPCRQAASQRRRWSLLFRVRSLCFPRPRNARRSASTNSIRRPATGSGIAKSIPTTS
jgi:precorrin-8X/cobalt-precorrin-8 methylmutase